MRFNPEIHHRESIRLKDYNYSENGAYFVTVCTQNRENLFGEIVEGKMILSQAGKIVLNCWQEIPQHFQNVELDEFCIMPNHFHGIIFIVGARHALPENALPENVMPENVMPENAVPENAVPKNAVPENALPENALPENMPQNTGHGMPCPYNKFGKPVAGSLSTIIGSFKSSVTKNIRKNSNIYNVWQRNYYEHIIRNENELEKIRYYININPEKWEKDKYNSEKQTES